MRNHSGDQGEVFSLLQLCRPRGPLGGPPLVSVIVEVSKALAKAVVTGVGLELARVASQRVRRRLGVKDDEETTEESDLERIKRENAELRRELDAIKAERNKAAEPKTS